MKVVPNNPVSRTISIDYMRAKSLFDNNEFERVVSQFQVNESADRELCALVLLSELITFQKSKSLIPQLNNSLMPSSKTVNKSVSNNPLHSSGAEYELCLLEKKAAAIHSRFANDSIINYIYAIIVSATREEQDLVRDLLHKSIKQCQYNWSAWLELARIHNIPPQMEDQLKQYDFFHLYLIEKGQSTTIESLHKQYPKWEYLSRKLGSYYHDSRDFKNACEIFKTLRSTDPFCSEGMDLYSNCLYVQERQTELSELAHFWKGVNPNSCETNIICGNYFSLKMDHEKAAMFFKRATAIDPHNINGWLLLGHELIELRNPSAALAAYQSAAKISKKNDVRPWYAIGQLFELINQFAFAVYYHNKAVAIDGSDVRIWKALSDCYEKLGRSEEAKECQKRSTFSKTPI